MTFPHWDTIIVLSSLSGSIVQSNKNLHLHLGDAKIQGIH